MSLRQCSGDPGRPRKVFYRRLVLKGTPVIGFSMEVGEHREQGPELEVAGVGHMGGMTGDPRSRLGFKNSMSLPASPLFTLLSSHTCLVFTRLFYSLPTARDIHGVVFWCQQPGRAPEWPRTAVTFSGQRSKTHSWQEGHELQTEGCLS